MGSAMSAARPSVPRNGGARLRTRTRAVGGAGERVAEAVAHEQGIEQPPNGTPRGKVLRLKGARKAIVATAEEQLEQDVAHGPAAVALLDHVLRPGEVVTQSRAVAPGGAGEAAPRMLAQRLGKILTESARESAALDGGAELNLRTARPRPPRRRKPGTAFSP